jgi:hypothetical protein
MLRNDIKYLSFQTIERRVFLKIYIFRHLEKGMKMFLSWEKSIRIDNLKFLFQESRKRIISLNKFFFESSGKILDDP